MNTDLILQLYQAQVIEFGTFKLKTGVLSPFYLDLRVLVSHPQVLRAVAGEFARMLQPLKFDRLAAIPYAALPIGTAVALEMDRPLIYLRREVKTYGTGRPIEGEYHPGEVVVVLDDLIATGASKLEAISALTEARLIVRDIAVLIDREQGGVENLQRKGYRVHAPISLRGMIGALQDAGKLGAEQYRDVLEFLRGAEPR